MTRFAAVDLGASSGRVIVGDESLRLTEVHRFSNGASVRDGALRWDVRRIFREILYGLQHAGPVDSIGVDSWGVDYGLLGDDGRLLREPVCYRDGRTAETRALALQRLGAAGLYEASGLQPHPINTVFQLMADDLTGAATMLLIPDLIAYWLTGERGAEITNASTTGLLDVRTRTWSESLTGALNIPSRILPPLRHPGTAIGPLNPACSPEAGLPFPAWKADVVAVASHDTASAVAAAPATNESFAYISCGTWSLVGVELREPVLSAASRTGNFTNEVGLGGTTRYLRNVMGLWLLQECLAAWGSPDLPGLLEAAARVPRLRSLVDAADPAFLAPGGMPGRIAAACRDAGQPEPSTPPETVRCILESLALAHRAAVQDATRLSGHRVEVVHLLGGGARNRLLCQLTADACGLPVVAGPAEATALGNIMVQARTAGVSGDLRALVAGTQRLETFHAQDTSGWAEAQARLDDAKGGKP
ncbi:rhamnulokinase [Nonomuraea typhae]|uniref:rhamnulokinase n=1 Tax=Nonomuraea typhae TaxID=2603600 RepID=UPI0012FBB688|nr:rhamnulokinase family protein [Nonomuraea typhae]